MAVASRGSMKPLERPMATQFFTQWRRMRPILMRITLGSEPSGAWGPRKPRNSSIASWSLRKRLEKT
jgi:hypothetical protein